MANADSTLQSTEETRAGAMACLDALRAINKIAERGNPDSSFTSWWNDQDDAVAVMLRASGIPIGFMAGFVAVMAEYVMADFSGCGFNMDCWEKPEAAMTNEERALSRVEFERQMEEVATPTYHAFLYDPAQLSCAQSLYMALALMQCPGGNEWVEYCINTLRYELTRYRWRLPLTGDGNADFLLAMEMGVGFIKALECEPAGELDPSPESMAGIFEAMQRGLLSFSSDHALGFFSAVESFLECALNHPDKFERLRARLRRLTADKLRERGKCILSGGVPPDIFFDDAR